MDKTIHIILSRFQNKNTILKILKNVKIFLKKKKNYSDTENTFAFKVFKPRIHIKNLTVNKWQQKIWINDKFSTDYTVR